MTTPRPPLDPTRLSPAAQKALAAGPARMVAARGLLPLPRPAELAAVLYQLALDGDAAIAAAAQATAAQLPDKLLASVLADPGVEPLVLDWLAARCARTPALRDALLAAPGLADDTAAQLAAVGDADTVDAVARNEQRLLRCPAVIAAMFHNPRARMSTVDRAVELAVRGGVRVEGIAAWDELQRALTGAATPAGGTAGETAGGTADDALFVETLASALEVPDPAGDAEAEPDGAAAAPDAASPAAVPEKKLQLARLSVPAKIRLATLGNAFARSQLIRDPIKMVAMAAIKSPGITDNEALKYASNQQLGDDVIRYIANRRDWTRLYGVKLSLVMNPKTPLQEVTRLLPHLRQKDLSNVAKSKGVPTAVAAQARKMAMNRGPGGGGG